MKFIGDVFRVGVYFALFTNFAFAEMSSPISMPMPRISSPPPTTTVASSPVPTASPATPTQPAPLSTCGLMVYQQNSPGIFWGKPYTAVVSFSSASNVTPFPELKLIRDSSGNSTSSTYTPSSFPFSVTSPPLPAAADGKNYGLTLKATFRNGASGPEIARCEAKFTVQNPQEQPGSCSVLVFQEENSPLIRWGKPYRVKATLNAPGRIADKLVLSLSTGSSSSDATYSNPANPLVTSPSPNNIPPGSGVSYPMRMTARYSQSGQQIAECIHEFDAKLVHALDSYISVAQVNKVAAKIQSKIASDAQLQDRLFAMFKNMSGAGGDGAEDTLAVDASQKSIAAAVLEQMIDQTFTALGTYEEVPYFKVSLYYPQAVVIDAAVNTAKGLICSRANSIAATLPTQQARGLKRACFGSGYCSQFGLIRRMVCNALIPISVSTFDSTVRSTVQPAILNGTQKLNQRIAEVLKDFSIDHGVSLVPSTTAFIQSRYAGSEIGFKIISGQNGAPLSSFACGVNFPSFDGSFAQCVYNNVEPFADAP